MAGRLFCIFHQISPNWHFLRTKCAQFHFGGLPFKPKIPCQWLRVSFRTITAPYPLGYYQFFLASSRFQCVLEGILGATAYLNRYLFRFCLLLCGTWQGIWGWYSQMRFSKNCFCRYWQHSSSRGDDGNAMYGNHVTGQTPNGVVWPFLFEIQINQEFQTSMPRYILTAIISVRCSL